MQLSIPKIVAADLYRKQLQLTCIGNFMVGTQYFLAKPFGLIFIGTWAGEMVCTWQLCAQQRDVLQGQFIPESLAESFT